MFYMANGSPINILEDNTIDPITLSIGIAMAVGAVTKAAHEKSVARQQYYAQRLNEEALKLQDKYPIRIHYTK